MTIRLISLCLLCGPGVALAAGQTVQQQINAIFNGLPGSFTLSGRIESESGDTVYYSRDAAIGKIPASVTKSFVVGASLALLGPDHQFVTRVYRTGNIDNAGALSGNIILLGNHDFTWASFYFAGNARYELDRLAEKLFDEGLRSVTGSVIGYGYLLYDGARSSTAATQAFRDALIGAGISVTGGTSTSSSFNPPGVPMAEWHSMPLAQACRDLMKFSDNTHAQALMRHLAFEMRGSSSDSVAEDLIQDWLESRGVNMNGSAFLEGSGLSRSNRVSALQAIGLTRAQLNSPEGWIFSSMLPIGGIDGTIGSRFTGGTAFGRVHAKTGTLTGVICLSGYVVNPIDNRRYLFAFLMNDISGFSSTTARSTIDQAVTVMTTNVDNLAGSVPGDVTLQSVLGDYLTNSATLSWSSATNAFGYNIYQSDKGSDWNQVASTVGTSIVIGNLPTGRMQSFYVRAVNAFGESKPSDAYAVRISNTPYQSLVVDGNDRWERSVTENTEQINHEFALRIADAVSPAVGIDSCANDAVINGTVVLDDYGAVLWMLGEESTVDQTYASVEQTLVSAYLNSGGNLFVSGAEIGWDLDQLGSSSDRSFYNSLLRANYVSDDAGTYQFAGVGGIFADLPQVFGEFHPTWMDIQFPDVISPLGGALSNLWYVGDNGNTIQSAGVQFDGSYRLVNLGFPFEAVAQDSLRKAMMNRILSFFFDAEFPDDVIVEARDLTGTLNQNSMFELGNFFSSTSKSHQPQLSGTGSRFIEYTLPNNGMDRVVIAPLVPVAGRYEVFVTWGLGANCFDAQYTVQDLNGETVLLVDQIPLGEVGDNTHTWVSLGEYDFAAGRDLVTGTIEVSEEAVSGRPSTIWNQRVYFDALRLELRERDPISAGDVDRDGDLDDADLDILLACLNGDSRPPISTPPFSIPACLFAFDGDEDDDIDLLNFADFQMDFGIGLP